MNATRAAVLPQILPVSYCLLRTYTLIKTAHHLDSLRWSKSHLTPSLPPYLKGW